LFFPLGPSSPSPYFFHGDLISLPMFSCPQSSSALSRCYSPIAAPRGCFLWFLPLGHGTGSASGGQMGVATGDGTARHRPSTETPYVLPEDIRAEDAASFAEPRRRVARFSRANVIRSSGNGSSGL
jgi:hypothetical protein